MIETKDAVADRLHEPVIGDRADDETDETRCVCGHLRREHDRAYPSGKYVYCCRSDAACECQEFVARVMSR